MLVKFNLGLFEDIFFRKHTKIEKNINKILTKYEQINRRISLIKKYILKQINKNTKMVQLKLTKDECYHFIGAIHLLEKLLFKCRIRTSSIYNNSSRILIIFKNDTLFYNKSISYISHICDDVNYVTIKHYNRIEHIDYEFYHLYPYEKDALVNMMQYNNMRKLFINNNTMNNPINNTMDNDNNLLNSFNNNFIYLSNDDYYSYMNDEMKYHNFIKVFLLLKKFINLINYNWPIQLNQYQINDRTNKLINMNLPICNNIAECLVDKTLYLNKYSREKLIKIIYVLYNYCTKTNLNKEKIFQEYTFRMLVTKIIGF